MMFFYYGLTRALYEHSRQDDESKAIAVTFRKTTSADASRSRVARIARLPRAVELRCLIPGFQSPAKPSAIAVLLPACVG